MTREASQDEALTLAVGYSADSDEPLVQSYILTASIMSTDTLFVRLDVHTETITMTMAHKRRDGEVRLLG